jgi:tetratricopeptide (TPR) repeat protein
MPRFFRTTFFMASLGGLLCSLTSCVSPLNVGEFERHTDAGLRLEHQGDYAGARLCFIRARAAAAGGFMPADAESCAVYNIARMNGMLGYFDIAEQQLKEALKLEEKVYGVDGGHASMRWFELARLYYAWGKYPDSVIAYEHAFELVDKLEAQNLDPITYAACRKDFADALDKTGNSPRAKQERLKAASIREAHQEPKILYYPSKLTQ